MLNDPKLVLHRSKVVFGLGCFLLAAYFTLTQIVRYLANEDTSSIAHKQFNQTPRDEYPTFSICFRGQDVYWKKEKILFQILGVTSSQYVNTLMGHGQRYEYDRKTGFYNKERVDLVNITSIDFKNVILDPDKVIVGALFEAQNPNQTTYFGKGNTGKQLKHNPFFVAYQTLN